MAGTVTTDLTFFTGATTGSSHGDTLTDWTVTATAAADTVQFIQGTGSLSTTAASASTLKTWAFACAATSITNKIIYFWFSLGKVGWLSTKSAGGLKLKIESSAANWGEWNIAGSDTLPHNGFICHAVHTSQAFTTSGGTIDKGAINKVTISAAGSFPGKAFLWVDALRQGTYLQIKGGTDVSPAVLEDLNTAEQTVTNQYGVLNKFGGIYFIQGQLLIGSTTAGDATYFKDANQVLVFRDSNVPADFYVATAQGNSTATTTIQMGNVTGTGSSSIGNSGVTVTTEGTKTWTFTATGTYIDNLKLYACTFSKTAPVEFGNATTAFGGSGQTIHLIDNTFNSPSYIIRNISSASTINQLKNKIAFATNTASSMDLYSAADTPSSEWQIIGTSTGGGKGFRSTATGTQTINILNHNFNQMDKPYITLQAEETWNSINPTWTITNQTELNFGGGTLSGASVNEKFAVASNVQQPDGTKINLARVKIVEANPTPAIVNEASTNASGDASFDTLRRKYEGAASNALTTTTHSTFSFKTYKYGRSPFAGAATIDSAISPGVTLLSDSYQVETNEATAVSDGTGKVVLVESAALNQSHSIIKVTNITTVAFAAGDILTGGTSGASGTIEEIIEGTGAIGTDATIILKLRNSTAFSGTEAVNRTGGGSSTLVSASEKRFYWLVQAGTISGTKRTLQQLYDHFQAKLGEATIDTADNWDKVVIDGAAEYGSPLQGVSLASPNSIKTIRNVALTHGWVISGLNSLLGLSAYTANDGTTSTPAVSTTVQLTNVVIDSRCIIFETANPSNVIMLTTATSSTVSTTYVWTGNLPITIRVRKSSTAPKYLPFETTGTITNTGFSLAVNQIADTIS